MKMKLMRTWVAAGAVSMLMLMGITAAGRTAQTPTLEPTPTPTPKVEQQGQHEDPEDANAPMGATGAQGETDENDGAMNEGQGPDEKDGAANDQQGPDMNDTGDGQQGAQQDGEFEGDN